METSPTECVFLAVPTGDGKISLTTLHTIVAGIVAPGANRQVFLGARGESLLCHNFNALWADCLNQREALNIRWFVMLHADVGSPDPHWLAKLIGIAEQHELEALSVAVRIKGEDRDTSTAFWKNGNIERLSLEAWMILPDTFDNAFIQERRGKTLLINTGMLALRVDADWAETFCWEMEDRIVRHPESVRFDARTLPEDWNMSLWFAKEGIRYGVTREIATEHDGIRTWKTE